MAVAAGAITGLAGGVVVTVGWVVEQATFEDKYLDGVDDLISFTGAPILIGPTIGASLAVIDTDAMWRVTGGGAAGMLVGTALGIGVGHLIRGGNRARWAGGAMGAALGLVAGAATMLIVERDTLLKTDDASARGIPIGFRVPLP